MQFGHTFGLVPGRAPLPWQFVHGAGLVSRSGIATPLVASRKRQLGLGLQVVAAPRPAGPRLLRAAAEQPAEQVADVGAAGLAGRVEQVVQVELGAVAAESAEVATAAVEPAAAEAAAGEQPSGLVVLLALGRSDSTLCASDTALNRSSAALVSGFVSGCSRGPACGRPA